MKKSIIVGSIICFGTLVVFLVFYNRLPAEVPIHFDSNGNVNSAWPREVVVFGIPIFFTIINLISGYSLQKKGESRNFMYFILPCIAVIVSIVVLVLAL